MKTELNVRIADTQALIGFARRLFELQMELERLNGDWNVHQRAFHRFDESINDFFEEILASSEAET